MTQKPLNITDILEEFDKIDFEKIEYLDGGEAFSTTDYKAIRAFLISSIRRSMEAVKPKGIDGNNGEGLPFENSPEIYGNQIVESYKKGYNASIDELEQNQTNFWSIRISQKRICSRKKKGR